MKEEVIYCRRVIKPDGGKLVNVIVPERVTVMARADGYAMVRRKGCLPFAVRERELKPLDGAPS